ncbi:hypothetical protein HGRIS_014708 [Hohenbuehelia grisea]|uniref:Acyl-CoA oxidase C-alpha1 domain-containing protein n=1 Tax=Hohenbuehelia grisea TaxID=104357 RepID=A0ABR3IQH8_9AGAR
MPSKHPFHDLARLPLFDLSTEEISLEKQVTQSLERAKAIQTAYCLTETDIRTLSQVFWRMHIDPIVCLDPAATSLLTIQLNLSAGTLAAYVDDQPNHRPLLQCMLRFEVSGQFCLTELDHGLDAINIETTAFCQPDGSFVLHTPHPGAAKFMPPTSPCGIPCYAIVFARVIKQGTYCGIRGFVVQLTDGRRMAAGVTSRVLPPRRGAHFVQHCITSFNMVRLPQTAMLGTLDGTGDTRLDFFQAIWRVAIGSLAIGSAAIPILQMSAYIAGRYSQRRRVHNGGKLVPIISFKTQNAPILTALAQAAVLKAFFQTAIDIFTADAEDPRVKHGIAVIFKVTAIQHGQAANLELSERCGAQGLFHHNQLSALFADMRGIAIAEGDLLGTSIRLASELVLGRYTMPESINPESLLARHEIGLLSHCRQVLATVGHHRSDAFSRMLLPRAQKIVQSIGHRMAYDAAVAAGVDQAMVDLYLRTAIRTDEAWYSEHFGMSAEVQFAQEDEALSTALPLLDSWLDATNVDPYVRAPIASDARWKGFVDGLTVMTRQDDLRGVEDAEYNDMIRAHL